MVPSILLWLALAQAPAPASCPDVAACRAEAEAAASRGEFEAFHDLAWRAVQKGKRNDPALMFLVARAQSLSGRLDDALVMLNRLADLHAPIDLLLPDFDRVRQLPGWAGLEAKVAGAPAPPAAAAPPAPSAAAPSADASAAAAASNAKRAGAPSSTPDSGDVT